jgi:hypothetical protein
MTNQQLDQLAINTIRTLSMDAVQQAKQEATAQLRQRNEELQQALGLYWQAQRREEQLRKMA